MVLRGTATKLLCMTKPKRVEKEWGYEIWLANNEEENYCGKILYIYDGHSSSLHYHLEKHETFYVTKGVLELKLIDTTKGISYTHRVHTGHTFEIDRGKPHQLIPFDGDVEFIEISTFHKDSDSYRIER